MSGFLFDWNLLKNFLSQRDYPSVWSFTSMKWWIHTCHTIFWKLNGEPIEFFVSFQEPWFCNQESWSVLILMNNFIILFENYIIHCQIFQMWKLEITILNWNFLKTLSVHLLLHSALLPPSEAAVSREDLPVNRELAML